MLHWLVKNCDDFASFSVDCKVVLSFMENVCRRMKLGQMTPKSFLGSQVLRTTLTGDNDGNDKCRSFYLTQKEKVFYMSWCCRLKKKDRHQSPVSKLLSRSVSDKVPSLAIYFY